MLKKIGLFLLTFIIIVVVAAFVYKNSLKPNYKGTEILADLQEQVRVYYDDYGIPHIFANNDLDAQTALGYVHAQDRLWQMELVSRISAGRLSEIFGEVALESDKFYLSLGIDKKAKEIVANIDKTTPYYKQTMAYLKGVNAYIKNGDTPIEFTILGVNKEAFNLVDIYNVFGYMSYGFAMGNQTDPLLSAIQEKLGNEYLKNLNLIIDPKSTLIKTHSKSIESDAVAFSKMIDEIRDKSMVPPFVGSNSWVLSPDKTKNKQVIFANDPHIGFSQPATWYQAHIKTPTTEIYGFYLAMTPFPLLGHNYHLAYGLTMFENDDIDLYLEKNNTDNDKEYLYGDVYKKYQIRTEPIPVKDAETVQHTIRETIHGPILNDVVKQIKTTHPVSMYWVYNHRPNKMLEACYYMSRAKNIEEFKKGPSLIHAPGLNVMYGDEAGNVAWWASANLYKRANNAPTKLFLDGSNPEDFNIDYRPFSENPQAINPNWKYVYSCNNQPDSTVSKRYIPGYFITQDRAKRVVDLIDQKNDWTLADTQEMITDITSSIAPDLKTILITNIETKELREIDKEAINELANWKGDATLKSIGTTIYTQFHYEYLKAVFNDELGKEIYNQLRKTHLMGRMLEPLMKEKYNIWMDDVHTKDYKESNADIQFIAFQKAVDVLAKQLGTDVNTWTWDRVISVEHKHPLGNVAALRSTFNVGPFKTTGTNEVLNNQIYFRNAESKYEIHGGPSTRRIIDFSDVDNAKAIIPTGNSGRVFSKHYRDQAQDYLDGKFIPMLLNENKIKELDNKLVLDPQ
jgi:penicillin amidase